MNRSGARSKLVHDPGLGGTGERTVYGGLKTKNVDVVVTKEGIGPVLAVSCKGAIGAFRNLTNRMEEAVGDCTNLQIAYPPLVCGEPFGGIGSAPRPEGSRRGTAVTHEIPGRRLTAVRSVTCARSWLTRRPALRYPRRTCPRHRATRACPRSGAPRPVSSEVAGAGGAPRRPDDRASICPRSLQESLKCKRNYCRFVRSSGRAVMLPARANEGFRLPVGRHAPPGPKRRRAPRNTRRGGVNRMPSPKAAPPAPATRSWLRMASWSSSRLKTSANSSSREPAAREP